MPKYIWRQLIHTPFSCELSMQVCVTVTYIFGKHFHNVCDVDVLLEKANV